MAVAYYNYMLDIYKKREYRKIQRITIRDVTDPFDLPDPEFQHIWRINKAMAQYLIEKLSIDLEPRGHGGLPAHLKILCAVQLLANGGYQRQIGQDHSLCHAQSTASKYIQQFTQSIYERLLSEWVHFPGTESARREVASGFEEKNGVPNILGLIDCTHVKIFPPTGPQGTQYKNYRKDAHTINVQLIVDSACKILSVNARYPDRVHDSFIWKHSTIRDELKRLHENRVGRYFLLGDSGYPLEPWLMTPILRHEPGSQEERYTEWHCQVRNGVERANGYLKGSFRCLGIDRTLHYKPEKCAAVIYACCILYRVPLEQADEEVGETYEDDDEQSSPALLFRIAQNRREELMQHFFRN